jgi:hypothetical protein
MKFKKLAISLVLVFMLAMPVFAHSGRTDGYGGHYNHSTGEYHYHHGYPAHSHRDADGDGDVDCPYNFDNKTGSNSGSSSGGKSSTTSNGNGKKTTIKNNGEQKSKSNSDISFYITIGILTAPLLLLIGNFAIILIRQKIKTISATKESKENLKSLGLQEITLPRNVFLLNNFDVSEGLPSYEAPYGTFTKYTTKRGRKYHVRRGCNGANISRHMYKMPVYYSPCKLCSKSSNLPIVIPDWYIEVSKAVKALENDNKR